MPDYSTLIQSYTRESAAVIAGLHTQSQLISAICDTIVTGLEAGHKILACGNGGSAAEAMHLCEELIGKYSKPRRPLPAICLNADPTAITCIANDWDYNSIFSRQIQALGQPGDVLVVFSSSGNSQNIVQALAAAKTAQMTTIGLLGKDGGLCRGACDLSLIVNSGKTNHIQEAHQAILHMILEAVEQVF